MPSLMLYIFMYLSSFILVMSSDDWFMIWLGLEVNMMSFIVMVYKKYSMNVLESCFKYYFVQTIGSAVFMGVFYMGSMAESIMLMVLSFKVGAGPFFFWFPVVCSGLNWMSCFVLMSFQKILPLMLISMFLSSIMWIVIFTSLLYGVLGSFNQVNVKQLMAYSSIHHLGWIFMCSMINDEFWFTYLVMYSLLLFVVCWSLMNEEIEILSMMGRWKRKLWFMLSMISMSGMPPMLGFILKMMAFVYIIQMDFSLVMMMLLMSVIMFYIYMRIVYDIIMSFGKSITWMSWLEEKSKSYNMDFVSLFGIILGLIMGVKMIF